MGLDNGISLRKIGQPIEKDDIPSYVKIELYPNELNEKNSVTYEVCYWRKCYDIRGMIFDVLNDADIKENEDTYYELSISSLEKIRDGIYNFLKNPYEWENSFWEFEEMILHLAQDIVNISWLINYLKEHEKDYAYFYDSY